MNEKYDTLRSENIPSQQEQFVVPDKYIISVVQVEKSLRGIKLHKAVGPDSVPNWVFKFNSVTLSEPMCSIWNASIREGVVPKSWKQANVSPMTKVTPALDVRKDIRPISLTPVRSKCVEFYVKGWVMEVLEDILDPHQFGSRKGCSTVLALVELHYLWLKVCETPKMLVRIFLLDFIKAFDTCDHNIVMYKLSQTDIPSFIVRWIGAFLSGREQRVKVADSVSKWSGVRAGVPQGTLLGPPCFLLHVNDLKTDCQDTKYVDDGTFWEGCHSDGHDSVIQTAADQSDNWIKENNMAANTTKSKEALINFGKSEPSFPRITLGGKELELVDVFKLLGVFFNSKLTWHDQVSYMCGKASRRLYFLYLLKKAGRKPEDILDVYVSTVRSVLEYAMELWHPGLTRQQSQEIEQIQHRALRIAYSNIELDEALQLSGLETLEERREARCKVFFSEICKPSHKLHYLLPEPRTVSKTRSKMVYPLPKCRTNRFKNSVINYCLYKFQDK